MKANEYNKLVETHGLRGRTVEACRHVLVDGGTAYQAAKMLDIEQSTISRALKKLRRPVCERCGQPIG
jgi:predicted transcriptional regulator